MDKKLINVIILGIAFMLIFTAFQTGGGIQQTIVKSINKETNGVYNASGYTSFFIIYGVFALVNWIAPSLVVLLGPRLSMIVGGLSYCLFMSNFLYPQVWILYFFSAIIGFGAAVIWTAQGNFLTLNSTKETMSRNSGIFWALLQCSLLFGNIFIFKMFGQDENISKPTRMWTYGVLTTVGVLGTILLLALRNSGDDVQSNSDQNDRQPIIDSFVNSLRLFITPRMLLLNLAFFYTGLELSFFSGVYGTTVGNTNSLDSEGNSKRFIGIVGMLIGTGEIVGGVAFGLLGSKTNKYGRDPIVILGYVVHMITFLLIYINFPKDSSLESTNDPAFINSSLAVALLCSFFLGFGDACFNTQVYSLLGVIYSHDSAPAFAVFKFTQSIAAAIAFLYSNVFNLHLQVLILAVFGSIGTVSFCTVEWQAHAEHETPTPNRADDKES